MSPETNIEAVLMIKEPHIYLNGMIKKLTPFTEI